MGKEGAKRNRIWVEELNIWVVHIQGQGLGSGVAWHFALFTAVECRVVEESAAFTVPTGSLEVFIPLRARGWLGAPLPFFQSWFGRHYGPRLDVVIKVVLGFRIKLPSRLQQIGLLQGAVDINLKLSVQTTQSSHFLWPGDKAGAVDSSEASLESIILHFVDVSLQLLQLLSLHQQFL